MEGAGTGVLHRLLCWYRQIFFVGVAAIGQSCLCLTLFPYTRTDPTGYRSGEPQPYTDCTVQHCGSMACLCLFLFAQVIAQHGGDLTPAVLDSMTYADAVIREVLRVVPPSASVFRKATVDMEVGRWTAAGAVEAADAAAAAAVAQHAASNVGVLQYRVACSACIPFLPGTFLLTASLVHTQDSF